jgi:hypothetical protein
MPKSRIRECARHILQDAHGAPDREPAVALDPAAQRLALHERHREVGHAHALRVIVVRRDVTRGQHADDVRMLQCGGEHDLALEAVDGNGSRELRRQHLHDDATAEGGVERNEHP